MLNGLLWRREKFLEAFEVQEITQKLVNFAWKSRSSNLDFTSISKKSSFCYFFSIKKGFWSFVVAKLSAFESTDTLHVLLWPQENILEAFEVEEITRRLVKFGWKVEAEAWTLLDIQENRHFVILLQ